MEGLLAPTQRIRVRILAAAPHLSSLMAKATGSYPADRGSIPRRGTTKEPGCCKKCYGCRGCCCTHTAFLCPHHNRLLSRLARRVTANHEKAGSIPAGDSHV